MLALFALVASLAMPAFPQTSTPDLSMIDSKLKNVNVELERAVRDLKAAEEFIGKSKLEPTEDIPTQLIQAGMRVKNGADFAGQHETPGAADTRQRVENVEGIVSDAAFMARPNDDARTLTVLLKQADRHLDASAHMLRQILASR